MMNGVRKHPARFNIDMTSKRHLAQRGQCISLALCVILALPSIIHAIPGPSGDWEAQDTSLGLLSAFNTSNGRTFDSTTCGGNGARLYLRAPRQSDIDLGLTISSALQTVATLGGGAVHLASGTYEVRTPIILPSYTCLFGAGMNKTVIRLRDYSKALEKRGLVRAHIATNVTIARLTVDGNAGRQFSFSKEYRSGQVGVAFELVNFGTIVDVRVHDALAAGGEYCQHSERAYIVSNNSLLTCM